MSDGLVAALARCQAKFPPIVKSHTNPAFKGSQYADVADVLAAVRPVLAAEGIAVSQRTCVEDDGTVLLLTQVMFDDDVQQSTFPLPVHGLTAQQVGSLMTYHRRYQLCAILGVHPVGDDDDGNLAATSQSYSQRRTTNAPELEQGGVGRTDPGVAPGTRVQSGGPTHQPSQRISQPEPLPSVPLSVPEKPIAAMTVAELISFARENGVTVSGSKSDMIRTLQPLVLAATGAEPFGLDAPAVEHTDSETRPFEPVVAT